MIQCITFGQNPPFCSRDHLISSHLSPLTFEVVGAPFHPSLSSSALRESPNPIPVYSLILSSHLFFLLLSLSLAEELLCLRRKFSLKLPVSWGRIFKWCGAFRYKYILIAKYISLPSECSLTNLMQLKRKHCVSLPSIPFSAYPHNAHFQTKNIDKSLDFFQIYWSIIVDQIHTYQILQTDLVWLRMLSWFTKKMLASCIRWFI